jgi:hypothetical protein
MWPLGILGETCKGVWGVVLFVIGGMFVASFYTWSW